MLWWKDQWLHLQQILWYMRIELHCPVYGFHCSHLRHCQTSLPCNIRREL